MGMTRHAPIIPRGPPMSGGAGDAFTPFGVRFIAEDSGPFAATEWTSGTGTWHIWHARNLGICADHGQGRPQFR